jgi:uncharacterized protein
MTVVSVRESRIQGRGVFAESTIRVGEVILEIDDSDPVLDRTKLTVEQEIFIDIFVAADGTQKITWMKSPERFINHSCDPNSFVQTDMTSGTRRVLARREIPRGDELTWDYALNILEAWVAPVPCKCGAGDCRSVIQGTYFDLSRENQRKYLPIVDEPFKRRFAARIQSLGIATGSGAH